MGSTLDIFLEVFTWVGFSAAVFFALVASVLVLIDGTWRGASAMIDDGPQGRVARWFAEDGRVGEAHLTSAEEHHVGGRDSVSLFYRLGTNRIRFHAKSPLIRLSFWLTIGFFAVGALAAAASLIAMFAGV